MAIQLVNSFVVSRIDNCNSLLVGLSDVQLDRKQSVLNYAVRITYGPGKYDHVTPFLRKKLHWLSGSSESAIQMLQIDVQVAQRTGFFIHILLLHKCLSGPAALKTTFRSGQVWSGQVGSGQVG